MSSSVNPLLASWYNWCWITWRSKSSSESHFSHAASRYSPPFTNWHKSCSCTSVKPPVWSRVWFIAALPTYTSCWWQIQQTVVGIQNQGKCFRITCLLGRSTFPRQTGQERLLLDFDPCCLIVSNSNGASNMSETKRVVSGSGHAVDSGSSWIHL